MSSSITGATIFSYPDTTSSGAIADQIDRNGFACLRDVVPEDWLAAARADALRYVTPGDVYEVFIDQFGETEGSLCSALLHDQRLGGLMRSITADQLPRLDTSAEDPYATLRIVTGMEDAPLDFHYDSSVVTAVIPLVIPQGGPRRSGELIICPDPRPYRRTIVGNAIDKMLGRSRVDTDPAKATIVSLEPGNTYLFWGYRSFHTTMPCPPGSHRVTLVLHFGRVHPGATSGSARALARRMRQLRRATRGQKYQQVSAETATA